MEFIKQLFSGIVNLLIETKISLGENTISLDSILKVILYLALTFIFINYLKKLLRNRILVKIGIDEGNGKSISTIISYSLGTLIFFLILQASGLNLSSLAVIAGGLGVGIGFGLQEITRNFVSGITLLIERSVKVGDFVEIDTVIGYVKEISIRSTIIHTLDGSDVILPNTNLVNNRMINWSYDSFVGRIILPVKVAHGSDPVLVTELLLKSAYMESYVLHDPIPVVIFLGFGDNSLDFELRVWIARIDDTSPIKSSLYFIIEYNLRLYNVKTPMAQRELWLGNPEAITDKLLDLQDANKNTSREQIVSSKSEINTQNYLQKTIVIRDLLKQISYFKNLNDLELRQLIEIGYHQKIQPSEILFRENEPGDTLYIILSGSVEVYVEKINKHLAHLQVGQFFGELALMLGISRTATVKANEETILFAIGRKGCQKLVQRNPEFYEAILRELSNHQEELKQRQQQLRELGLLNAEEDDSNPMVWVRNRLQKLFNLEIV